MKRNFTGFLAGILCGAVIFGGGAAYAAGILAERSTHKVTLDGQQVSVEAYVINGSNYFQLRDIAKLLNVGVNWNSATRTVEINSQSGYTEPTQSNQTGTQLIGEEAAKSAALKHAGLSAGSVTFLPVKLEWEDGRQVYDVEFFTADGKEYDYEIDALTGAVIKYDYETGHPLPSAGGAAAITADRAKAIALAKVPGATESHIYKFESGYDDDRLEYEIEIRYNGTEYEFEIDGATGAILKMESEPIGH